MGLYSDLMGFYGDLMGFIVIKWYFLVISENMGMDLKMGYTPNEIAI